MSPAWAVGACKPACTPVLCNPCPHTHSRAPSPRGPTEGAGAPGPLPRDHGGASAGGHLPSPLRRHWCPAMDCAVAPVWPSAEDWAWAGLGCGCEGSEGPAPVLLSRTWAVASWGRAHRGGPCTPAVLRARLHNSRSACIPDTACGPGCTWRNGSCGVGGAAQPCPLDTCCMNVSAPRSCGVPHALLQGHR